MTMHETLARRAVQCAAWRWLPGMRVLFGGFAGARMVDDYDHAPGERDLPDLDDPATLGALLSLVREAHDDPMICAVAHRSEDGPVRWWIDSDQCPVDDLYAYDSEAEALVAALEAAGGGD